MTKGCEGGVGHLLWPLGHGQSIFRVPEVSEVRAHLVVFEPLNSVEDPWEESLEGQAAEYDTVLGKQI